MDKNGKYRYKFGLFVRFEREKAHVEELKIITNNNDVSFQWVVWVDEREN